MLIAKRIASLMLGAAVLAPLAWAHDLAPPPWRGDPGSTFQHWMFNQPPNPLGPTLPEQLHQNPGLSQPSYLEPGPYGWHPEFLGMGGVLSLPAGSALSFFIPNYDEPPPHFKKIRVQLTWFTGNPNTIVIPPGGQAINGSVNTQPIPGTPWNHSTVDFELNGCPPFEYVAIRNLTNDKVFLDQVVIDTICTPVPEPATLAALGIGTLAFIRRKRK